MFKTTKELLSLKNEANSLQATTSVIKIHEVEKKAYKPSLFYKSNFKDVIGIHLGSIVTSPFLPKAIGLLCKAN